MVSMWVLAGLATATVSRNLFEEPVLPSTASMNVLLQHVNIPGDLVPLPASDFPLTTSATWRRQSRLFILVGICHRYRNICV